MIKKEYLGDSVYAEYDGIDITLTTENGKVDDPSNIITLEPEVFQNLVNFNMECQKEDSN